MFEFGLKFPLSLFPINNIPAMVQIMAWRRPGDKPLSEPMQWWLVYRRIYASLDHVELSELVQWNLSVTTTSKIKCITFDLFSNVF